MKSTMLRSARHADTRHCVQTNVLSRRQPLARGINHQASLSSVAGIQEYFKTVSTDIFHSNQFSVREIDEGKINHVYHVSSSRNGKTRSILLKYAPPYVKSVGESFSLSQERMRVEAASMQWLLEVCPEHVPAFVFYDERNSMLAMEFMEPPYLKVVSGLHDYRLRYTKLAQQLGFMLACMSVKTRRDFIDQERYEENLVRFRNIDIVTANERVVLIDPMDPACTTNYTSTCPKVKQEVEEFRSSPTCKQALTELLQSYRKDKHVLIHNDLHTGNLLATQEGLACIDWEFATYGPAAFDIGNILGVLALGLITIRAQADEVPCLGPNAVEPFEDQEFPQEYIDTAAWIGSVIPEVWRQYLSQYMSLCQLHGLQPWSGSPCSAGPAQSEHALFRDVLGFMAFSIFRLTAGLHSYPGYGRLVEPGGPEAARIQAVHLARQLLELRKKDDVSSMLQGLEEALFYHV